MTAEDANIRRAAEHARAGAQAYAAGDLAKALGSYFMALALAPKHPIYLHTAVALIGISGGYALPPLIKTILGDAAQDPGFNCQPLATATHSDFIYDPSSKAFLDAVLKGGDALEAALRGAQFDSVLNDRLLRAVLQRAVIVSPLIEALIATLRRHALERAAAGRPTCLLDSRLDFLACLAAQCFNAEYAFNVSLEESGWLDQLLADAEPRNAGVLALIGAYRPLCDVIGDEFVPDAAANPNLAYLFRQQITEPRREKEIEGEIPELAPIVTDFSGRMRAQYEDFPYPRWFAVDYAVARPFKQVVEERFPGVPFGALPSQTVDILIPGCGTGHQIAQVAAMFKGARITAVDLSRRSLAYARRKLDERGITLHRFGQADILALGSWQDRFDFIECMGVLHHLERPEEGLKILTGLLRPGGILRLGLYSERARRHIMKARQFVVDRGLPDTIDGVRAARRLIAALPGDDPVREVIASQDYFSIAGLHDLIFNVQECRYTPLGLKKLLRDTGLEFLGFDHPDPGVDPLYRARFPADKRQIDLESWEDFEIEFPDTFASMFQLWCRPARDL